ncbi:MAG TPA: hypothetical protein DEP18_01190 [Flavobacteriales bacterium]|nr:hypothetical protein [Flavobacteriales bacterium]HCA82371.1 hypothetical protein [Flavobacteriales bacterium]HRE76142.1 hypothetical protein [Flavobacteriales bacterium]HRE98277.1 hypothetical protein [Flavobacteriales bacterium]HRJ34594.1 hypothetical protein [Flavobacteriales bacterium]
MKKLQQYHEQAGRKENAFEIWNAEPSDFQKTLRAFFLFCLLFSSIIFIDYFLPRKTQQEVVTNWRAQSQYADLAKGDKRIEALHEIEPLDYRISTASTTIALQKNDADHISPGDTIIIRKTILFSTTTSLTIAGNKTIYPFMNFYSWLLFIPLCLTLFSLLALFRPLKTESLSSMAVLNILLLAAFVTLRLFYL